MSVDAILWILLPAFVAAGSALLSYILMQARLEVAVANERESAAKLQAQLHAQQGAFESKLRAVEEEAKRTAFDAFLAEIRVDERRYVREFKTATTAKKALVIQERLFFRHLPLSNWVEREMLLEEESEAGQLSQSIPTFSLGASELSLRNKPDEASSTLAAGGPWLVKADAESGLRTG